MSNQCTKEKDNEFNKCSCFTQKNFCSFESQKDKQKQAESSVNNLTIKPVKRIFHCLLTMKTATPQLILFFIKHVCYYDVLYYSDKMYHAYKSLKWNDRCNVCFKQKITWNYCLLWVILTIQVWASIQFVNNRRLVLQNHLIS